eukprot:SAG31_NODE_3774_length_3896_cov_2.664209_1_plen_59_part_00
MDTHGALLLRVVCDDALGWIVVDTECGQFRVRHAHTADPNTEGRALLAQAERLAQVLQ